MGPCVKLVYPCLRRPACDVVLMAVNTSGEASTITCDVVLMTVRPKKPPQPMAMKDPGSGSDVGLSEVGHRGTPGLPSLPYRLS